MLQIGTLLLQESCRLLVKKVPYYLEYKKNLSVLIKNKQILGYNKQILQSFSTRLLGLKNSTPLQTEW